MLQIHNQHAVITIGASQQLTTANATVRVNYRSEHTRVGLHQKKKERKRT